MTTFRNPNDPNNTIITAKVQEWTRLAMDLKEDTIIEVVEVDCADPGCMDKETKIILTTGQGNKKQFRIHKPLVYVRKPDIQHLVK
jgi:hypothetical protein